MKISTGDQIYLRINDTIKVEFNGVICSMEDGEYPNIDTLLHLSNGKTMMLRDIRDGDYKIFYGMRKDSKYIVWEYIEYLPSNHVQLMINNIQYS